MRVERGVGGGGLGLGLPTQGGERGMGRASTQGVSPASRFLRFPFSPPARFVSRGDYLFV